MKRDMGLVRDILFVVERREAPVNFDEVIKSLGSHSTDTLAYHVRMLVDEAGFLRGIDASSMDRKAPKAPKKKGVRKKPGPDKWRS